MPIPEAATWSHRKCDMCFWPTSSLLQLFLSWAWAFWPLMGSVPSWSWKPGALLFSCCFLFSVWPSFSPFGSSPRASRKSPLWYVWGGLSARRAVCCAPCLSVSILSVVSLKWEFLTKFSQWAGVSELPRGFLKFQPHHCMRCLCAFFKNLSVLHHNIVCSHDTEQISH